MQKKYVCKYSFGKYKKGEPYKGSERDINKLLANDMICPLLEEGANSEKKQLEGEQEQGLNNALLSQAGQVLQPTTAKKLRTGKKKNQANV